MSTQARECICASLNTHHARFTQKLYGPQRDYFASKATPTHTSAAEIQRRRSTSSLRKTLAATALQIKVRDAEDGATRLASPQESAVNRLKKPSVMQLRATRNVPSLKTRTMTSNRPLQARS